MKHTMSSMKKSEQPHDILDKGVYNNMPVEIKGHSAIGLVKGADFEENKVQVLIWVDADKVMEAD